MKKLTIQVSLILSICIISAVSVTAQTSKDSVNAGKIKSPMVVDPGHHKDGMAVNPGRANDGMAMMTDTGFISKNIADNILEIQMIKIALSKGTLPQVKKLAPQMLTDHNAMLDAWRMLAEKRGIQGLAMEAPHKLPPTKDNKDFDALWASAMLTMHVAKVQELEKHMALTQDADLKLLIGKALNKVRTHKEMLAKVPGAKLVAGPNTVTH